MAYRFKRVVVKVGSNVLARPDGSLDVTRMSALADQVAELHRGGVEVILVSSARAVWQRLHQLMMYLPL